MLRLQGVEKTYGDGLGDRALAGVTLTVAAGEFCALVGPSGSGKSTLMNIMGLLDRPTRGQVFLRGAEVTRLSAAAAAQLRNRAVGFVFQAFQLLPRLTACENVALPLLYRGCPSPERRRRARDALGEVGLADRVGHRPDQLSGGQRQRVAIARALVGEPAFVLADEPTGSLDSRAAGEVIDLFERLNRASGLTILMVTHDPALARRCGRQVRLLDGRIVGDSGADHGLD